MKWLTVIFFLFTPIGLLAQTEFKTIVPNQPVVAGESFQVQYVIPQTGRIANFKAPSFKPFRLVSGPNQYTGTIDAVNASIPVVNYVFTLEAVRPGKFIIPGAFTTVNGKTVQSNDVLIEVISKQQASKLFDRNTGAGSDYLLRSGEDPYEKIRQNLFLRVMVDRTKCFTGEPILATFKLYSRLQSRSDIIKNPGFYGFTVYDMVNLADKEMMTEEVNGKLFDVHTIRKVQLFPLQPGLFIIDPMEVKNKVEFSRSQVNKKTEQEIAEGMLSGNEDSPTGEDAEIYETTLSTSPIKVQVNPLPSTGMPVAYGGAVGNFNLSAAVVKSIIAKNEEGIFEVTVSGQGNFTQLNPPVISWPAGIEGFEPAVKDAIDETKVPLGGARTFRYPFVCTAPGQYDLPAVQFSFFNPAGKYQTVSSSPVHFTVSKEGRVNRTEEKRKTSITQTNESASRTAAIIIISLVVAVFVYWIFYNKKETPVLQEAKPMLPTVDEILGPALLLKGVSDGEFYTALRQSIWQYFQLYFHLSGSNMSKETLVEKLHSAGVNDEEIKTINNLLYQCEAGIFTQAHIQGQQEELLQKTKKALEKIREQLL